MSETTAEQRAVIRKKYAVQLALVLLEHPGSATAELIDTYEDELCRLVADVDRLETERETEAKRWAEYLDWLDWIADCANDPNYGSEAERLALIAQAVKDQEKKETPPFVEFIWDRMLAAEERAKQAEAQLAQLGEAVGRVKSYHGAEIIAEQKAGNDTHDLQGCDVCAFLAGLPTEGPKIDFLYMTRDQQERPVS